MGHLILLRATRETTVNETSHLSVDDAASYIDGTLSDDAREVVERHLAECDSCREEVAASARLVATYLGPSPGRHESVRPMRNAPGGMRVETGSPSRRQESVCRGRSIRDVRR